MRNINSYPWKGNTFTFFLIDRGSRSSFELQGAVIASLFSDSRNGTTTTQVDNDTIGGLDTRASNNRYRRVISVIARFLIVI